MDARQFATCGDTGNNVKYSLLDPMMRDGVAKRLDLAELATYLTFPSNESVRDFKDMATRFLTVLALSLLAGGTASAADCGKTQAGFDGFKKAVLKEAAAKGMSEQALDELRAARYDQSVIKRDRAQNIFSQSFLEFQGRMITNYRIKQGAALIKKHGRVFEAVEQQYGVPAPVITAFWALETDFGANIGDFPTLQALVTLAWDCRRPENFRPQLFAALDLINRGDLAPEEMRGAWAGEIGQTQFMAYDYDESAVDFDGDGRRDLRQSIPDVMASTANLLRKHGWQPGQPWLQEVQIPADMAWDQADIAIQHPRSQWAKWGVTAVSGKKIKADDMPASLLLPMGRNGPAFLAYSNFTKAYLKWNESLVYSTTAAYLATRIAGAPPVSKGRAPIAPLDYEGMVELQKYLAAQGYDVGKIDGKLGKGTRAAVKDMQMKMGLPADSYPTQEFLSQLN
jgi:lytic murein transglycosylase